MSMQFKSYVFICKLKASIALRNISFELIDRNEALRVIETQVTIFNGKLTKQTIECSLATSAAVQATERSRISGRSF